DAENGRDVAVGFALGQPEQGLSRARGEPKFKQRLGRGEVRLESAGGLCLLGGAVQSGFNRAYKILIAHRLGQVIVGAEIHAGAQVFLLTFSGEEYEGNQGQLRVLAKGAKNRVAVELWHGDVAQDQIR